MLYYKKNMFNTQVRNAYEARLLEREMKRHPAYYPLLIQWSQYFMETLIELGVLNLIQDQPQIGENGYVKQNKKMGALTRNENIVLETIRKYPHLQWVDYMAKWNPYLNSHYYLNEEIENVDVKINTPYDMRYVDIDYIQKNPDIDWDYSTVIRKIAGVSQSFILEHLPYNDGFFHYDEPIEHNQFTWDLYEENIEHFQQVHPNMYSQNPALNIDIVKSHPEIEWTWMFVSSNPGIYLEDVLSNPDLNWNHGWLSKNPNVRPSMVYEYPQIKWNIGAMTRNPAVTFEDMMKYPELEWNHYLIWLNPNVTFDIIRENPERFPLTDEYCKEYLCQNDFTKMRVEWILEKMKSTKVELHQELILKSWHFDRALDWNF